jgi:hypothetical protein
VTISFPLLDWFDDSFRHPEHFVDFAVDFLGLAVAADCQAGFSLRTGQADGEHLMDGKLLTEGSPRSVNAGVQDLIRGHGEFLDDRTVRIIDEHGLVSTIS